MTMRKTGIDMSVRLVYFYFFHHITFYRCLLPAVSVD